MSSDTAIMNWSGGKDAAFCLYKVLQEGNYKISHLLTTANTHYRRVTQHGVRIELMEMQAKNIGLPLHTLWMPRSPSMKTYSRLMAQALEQFKDQHVTTAIFGDIFLEDVRAYRERQLASLEFTGVFPLWQQPTGRLVRQFIETGFKAVVVCVDERYLDKGFAGREIDYTFLEDLPEEVDPCGENGEFHSFVYDGPLFDRRVPFEKGEITYRKYESAQLETGFWYCDLLPFASSHPT